MPLSSYTSASRVVLNSTSYPVLLLLVAVVCVGGAILVLYLIRRVFGPWRSGADAVVVAGIAAMVLTLFALLLAFGIVTLYNQHQSAQSAVAREADDLAQVERDSAVLERLGLKPQQSVSGAISQYICSVENQEFPAMHDGRVLGKVSSARLTAVFTALSSYQPSGQSQSAFYTSSVTQLNDAVAQRRDRIEAITDPSPSPSPCCSS